MEPTNNFVPPQAPQGGSQPPMPPKAAPTFTPPVSGAPEPYKPPVYNTPPRPTPPPTPTSFTPPPPPPPFPNRPVSAGAPHKHHVLSKVIVLVIIILIGAAIAYASSVGIFNSPQTAVKNALLGLDKVKTVHGDVTIQIDYTTNNSPQTLKLLMNADTDKTDPQNPSMDATMSFAGLGLTADFNLKMVNKVIYFKINQLPMLGASGNQLLGTWFSMSQDDLKKLAELSGRPVGTLDFSKQTSYDSAKFLSMLENAGAFNNVSSLGFSSRNGYVRSYKITLSNDELEQVAMKLFDSIDQQQAATTGTSTVPKLDPQVIKSSLDAILRQVTVDPVIVDVGVADGILHGFSAGLTFTPQSTSTSTPSSLSSAHLTISASYSKFNSKVTVSAPDDSKSFLDIISASLTAARQKGMDARIQADLMQMRTTSEMYWSKHQSYSGACSDATAKILITDITTNSGTVPACIATSKAFAVASKLSTGTYFCVDSTGAAKNVLVKPTTAICK